MKSIVDTAPHVLQPQINSLYGSDATSLDLFETDYKLNVLTIKVQCQNCGHVWGIKVDDYSNIKDIPERKFMCTQCSI